jgi:hypothetical protein
MRLVIDTSGDATRILEVFLKGRILRIGGATSAVIAVLALSILPAMHLHRSTSGKSLVHSHLIDHPIEHEGMLDHGDHHGVRTFPPVFTVERPIDALPTLAVAIAVFLATPEPQSSGYSEAIDAPAIHGPPIRSASLRAPPAFPLV